MDRTESNGGRKGKGGERGEAVKERWKKKIKGGGEVAERNINLRGGKQADAGVEEEARREEGTWRGGCWVKWKKSVCLTACWNPEQ